MKIAVIDGQGGGIGYQIILKLKEVFSEKVEVIALGTNAVAASNMLKAKANKGASGENAIMVSIRNADLILGPLSLVIPNSMMGELTPKIAEAIAMSSAKKILLPLLNQDDLEVIGITSSPLPHQINDLIVKIKDIMEGKDV